MSKNTSSKKLGFVENFMISGVTAAFAKTSSAPIERVKLLIQNQNELIRQSRLTQRFNGISDCAISTLKNEGVLSFWRGNFASVVRYFPQQALNFAFKDQIHKLVFVSKNASYKEKFTKNIVSGGIAGSLSLVFVQSLDYTRTRLATDALTSSTSGKGRQFSGIVDCYRKTIVSDGVLGLYRGFLISCCCIFVYRGLYFGLYDSFKPLVLQNKDYSNKEESGSSVSTVWLRSFLLGWIVTITSGFVAYPIDTVKRRMMLTACIQSKTATKNMNTTLSKGVNVNELRYVNSWSCFRSIIINEGWKSLFNGVSVNVVRGLAGAGVLSGFDYLKHFYLSICLTNKV